MNFLTVRLCYVSDDRLQLMLSRIINYNDHFEKYSKKKVRNLSKIVDVLQQIH